MPRCINSLKDCEHPRPRRSEWGSSELESRTPNCGDGGACTSNMRPDLSNGDLEIESGVPKSKFGTESKL